MSRPGLRKERVMPTAHLADRGVVQVTGEEAKSFLDGRATAAF